MVPPVAKAAVGLGNPGPHYRRTRHNIGFLAVDHYLARSGHPHRLTSGIAVLYRVNRLLLAKPITYMNLSGPAVADISERFDLSTQQCLIIYDDVALPFGTLRAKARSGSGGHRGMASVIEALDTREIPRLRLGIGKVPLPDDLTEYVLSGFAPDEVQELDGFLDVAADAIDRFYQSDIETVMNEFNA